jgi:hypothetical protein
MTPPPEAAVLQGQGERPGYGKYQVPKYQVPKYQVPRKGFAVPINGYIDT